MASIQTNLLNIGEKWPRGQSQLPKSRPARPRSQHIKKHKIKLRTHEED